MTKVNGILLIYHHHLRANAPTIDEHVDAFIRHSSFPVWKVNTALGFPKALRDLKFDALVLHYSLFGLPIYLNESFLSYIGKSQKTYKIAFFQDEHRYWPERSDFINSYGIDCIFTLLEPRYFEHTYWKHTNVSKLIHCLPGYVSDDLISLAKKLTKPDEDRTIDVGYRGRRLPYYMGRGSQEKHIIGVRFREYVASLDLRVDIETDESKRIYGMAWPKFVANCRALLGVETGVSVFDVDNIVRPQYAKICKSHPDASFPDCSFEEFHDYALAPHEDKIFYRTIGPRHFEAAAFRVCQILFEGKYSGILQPMVHYLPLKKDFSNIDQVIRLFKDADFRRELTENAYRDLIASGKYSYESFIKSFDENLLAQGLSPEFTQAEIEQVQELLNGDKLRRYARFVWTIMRHSQFPGRGLLTPLLRPVVRYFKI
jgi:hypothetical protein